MASRLLIIGQAKATLIGRILSNSPGGITGRSLMSSIALLIFSYFRYYFCFIPCDKPLSWLSVNFFGSPQLKAPNARGIGNICVFWQITRYISKTVQDARTVSMKVVSVLSNGDTAECRWLQSPIITSIFTFYVFLHISGTDEARVFNFFIPVGHNKY